MVHNEERWFSSSSVKKISFSPVIVIAFILMFLNIIPTFSQTLPAQLWSLEYNTPSEIGLDIIFVPTNYTEDEMDRFRSTVEIYYRTLLSIEPFSNYRNATNVWRIDSTIDLEPKRNPTMERLLTVNYDKTIQLVKSVINIDIDFVPPDDQIIVLVDTSIYGGSGYTSISVTYTGELGERVMIHEFGHSFGGLGDEYVVHDEDYPGGQDIPYPNIDWDGSKWKDVPGTGAYLGAWYRNLVRPTYDSCIMRTLSYFGFCPVCRRALASRLEHYSPTIALKVSIGIAGIEVKIDNDSHTADLSGDVLLTLGRGYHTITLEDTYYTSDFVRYSFKRWEDDSTSPSRRLYLANDTTITASYQLQYYLLIESSHNVPTNLSGSGWYDEGSIATVSISSEIVTEGQTKHVFTGWTGDYSGTATEFTIHMDAPKNVTASWKTQYYLAVNTEHGTTRGSGWYDAGSTARFSIGQESVPVEGLPGLLGAKYVFEGWSDDYAEKQSEASVVMNSPQVITAQWKTDYTIMYLSIGTIISAMGVIAFILRKFAQSIVR